MNKALITVEKKQFTDKQIRSLEQIIIQNYKSHIDRGDLKIVWNMVPSGNIYRNYKKSQLTIIGLPCDINFPQEKREMLFKNCIEDWVTVSGQHANDIIIGVFEYPTLDKLMKRNSIHLSGYGKLKFYSHVFWDIWRAKMFRGYRAFNSSI